MEGKLSRQVKKASCVFKTIIYLRMTGLMSVRSSGSYCSDQIHCVSGSNWKLIFGEGTKVIIESSE